MPPQVPPTTPAAPQRTSFEDFKTAVNGFNDSSSGVSNRVGAWQAAQVQPNFQYQQDLAAQNAALSLANKAASGEGFVKQPKADGGFDFFDPYGKKITVHQYSSATNSDPVKVLADSNNSRDRQFVADYNHVQTLANALVDNNRGPVDKLAVQLFGQDTSGISDKTKKAAAEAQNQKIMDKFYQDLHDNYSNGDQLIKGFMQYYPEVYSDLAHVYAPQHPANQLPNYTLPGV